MTSRNRWIATLAAVAVLTAAGGAGAQDWPQWRGPDRDGKTAGFAVPAAWPASPAKQWQAKVGPGDATPALVGDHLYVFTRQGGSEVVLCLNAADGSEVWKQGYPAPEVKGAASRHPGPRGSPLVADGKVVALGATGIVTCFNASDGKVLWRADPYPNQVPTFFTSMSPMAVDDTVIVHLGGKGKGGLLAYDLASGEQKWRWAGEAPEYASPVLMTSGGTKQIVTLTEKSVVGVAAADGRLLWQLPFPPARRAYNAATPIVDGSTVIYTGAARGTFAVTVEKAGDAFAARPVWSNEKVAVQYNTPVLKDGYLYGMTAGGNLFCASAKTGETAWVDEARHGRGFCAIVDVGPCLMALPSTGELIIYKPDPQKYDEVARYKVSDRDTYAHPVPSGKRIVIRDQETVALWTVE